MNENHPSMESEVAKPVEFQIVRDSHVRQLLRDRTEAIVEKVYSDGTDAVVFLDKGARPISWLFREVWKKNHGTLNRPQIRFMNVGRPNDGMLAADRDSRPVSADAVGELRTLFGSQFANKDVTIVDDLSATGKTLEAATRVFREAFPSARVDATFVSDGWDMPEDRFPWSEIPGSTDVLELSESIVSHSALAHRIDALYALRRQEFERVVDAPTREAIAQTLKERYGSVAQSLHEILETFGELPPTVSVPKEFVEQIQSLLAISDPIADRQFDNRVPKNKKPTGELYLQVARMYNLAEEMRGYFSTRLGDLKDRWSPQFLLSDALDEIYFDAQRILYVDKDAKNLRLSALAKETVAYADPSRLAGLADQLRAEMKAIAAMPVSKE